MSSKTFGGSIRTDKSITVIHGGSVPKKNEIGGGTTKKGDMSQSIKMAKIENEERGLCKITREFAQTLIDGRKALGTDDKSFTQKDLANKSGVPLSLIQLYEKVDSVIDPQFQTNCAKIKKALGVNVLPKIIAPKLAPIE